MSPTRPPCSRFLFSSPEDLPPLRGARLWCLLQFFFHELHAQRVEASCVHRLMGASRARGQHFLTQKASTTRVACGHPYGPLSFADVPCGRVKYVPARGGGGGFALPRRPVQGRLMRQRRQGVWEVAFPGQAECVEVPVGQDGLFFLELCEGAHGSEC